MLELPPGMLELPPGMLELPPGMLELPPGMLELPPGMLELPPGTLKQPSIDKWQPFNWMMGTPNLYIGNAWKSPFPSIYKWLALGFQAGKCLCFDRF